MLLRKKICIVTGSSRGIGRSIAEKLAREGASVAVTYLQERSKALEVVSGLDGGEDRHMCLQLDVRDRQSVKHMVESVLDRYRRIDVLVNNAGINKPTDFDRIEDEDWDAVIRVNLTGAFICSGEVMEVFRKQGSGVIVNISSVSGQYGGPRTAHYAVSKAGLISLAQVMARYGAKFGVRANTVAPGLIRSEMASRGLSGGKLSGIEESILLGRLGEPAEVACAVAYLASDEASYITGQTLNVNGGLYF